MSITIVTFAKLGDKRNLKTDDIESVINKFYKEGELESIFCYQAKNFYHPNTYSCIPRIYLIILKNIKKIFPSFNRRKWEEKIFDFICSFKLRKTDFVFIHPNKFPRTLKKAKKNRSITISIATASHPKFNHNLLKKEYYILGLNRKKIKYPKGEIFCADKIDYTISLSESAKKTYINYEYPKDKIYVATIDCPKINGDAPKSIKTEKFIVLYIAGTTILKGLHYLLEVWKNINIPNKQLIIVGEIKLPSTFKEKIKTTIEQDETIKKIGHTRNIKEFYQQASIFILPSLTEGLPKVTLEAMTHELPVITTVNASGIITHQKNGLIISIRNPQAIKDNILYLYNNPYKRGEIGKEAKKTILNKVPFENQVYKIYKEIKHYEFHNKR
jgi:glycosyltransferase involved in cell wall biosynthesis